MNQAQSLAIRRVEDWGIIDYASAYHRQLDYVRERVAGTREDTLIFAEHYPVFTIGARQKAATHIVWDDAECQQRGIEIVRTNRGGDVTYHGPGQIVGYPIVSLHERKDLHAYLRILEQVLIATLGALGLAAHRRAGMTGLWLQERKIAAIGVAVQRWVAYHGFALNVNVDVEPFAGIIPCGIATSQGTVTSMREELGTGFDLQAVKNVLEIEFWKLFAER